MFYSIQILFHTMSCFRIKFPFIHFSLVLVLSVHNLPRDSPPIFHFVRFLINYYFLIYYIAGISIYMENIIGMSSFFFFFLALKENVKLRV